MLKKENRLYKMKDFEILFKEGRFVAGKLVDLKVWKIEPNKYPRRKYEENELKIGFVAGLKVSKSAVKRNRIKRQMREIVRLLIKDNKLKIGYHVAILAKPVILGCEYGEIEKSMVSVLQMSGLLIE